jgi:hypothetical protein
VTKSKDPWIRRSQRVIRMVSELHRMGFQRIRFMPYEYPLAYRIQIAPVACFSVVNGCHARSDAPGVTYSSASENRYFEWTDAKSDDARGLAARFVDRFPEIAGPGAGRDWAYAGWLLELLGTLEKYPNRLPALFWEYSEVSPEDMRSLSLKFYGERGGSDSADRIVSVPLPPPGEGL